MKKLEDVRCYLDEVDSHLSYLLEWVSMLEDLKTKVIRTQSDDELAESLGAIINKLTFEIGFRMTLIFKP